MFLCDVSYLIQSDDSILALTFRNRFLISTQYFDAVMTLYERVTVNESLYMQAGSGDKMISLQKPPSTT